MLKPITVRLVGGLGNQLFGYYAGAALAAHHGVPLRLDTSWTRHGITDHGIEILRLDLPGEWLDANSIRAKLAAPGSLPGRVIAKALRDSTVIRRQLNIHEPYGIGHDPTLMAQPPGTRLRGYFQSWQIVELAVSSGVPRRPRLRRQSSWLERLIHRAEAERPLAVHVRRGDYSRVPEFGLLGPDYYEPAIQAIRGQGVDGPIWLFSDDREAARVALGDFSTEVEWISSPEGPTPEMLAMSFAAANVIANSTFSWWGAWMGTPGRPVVAPDPWFISGPAIEGLIPPGWLTQAWLP